MGLWSIVEMFHALGSRGTALGYLSQLHGLIFECLGRKTIFDESSSEERVWYFL